MNNKTINKTIFLAAPREIVWACLTNKDRLGEWFHPGIENLEEGRPYQLYKAGEGIDSTMLSGVVSSANKPAFLSYTGTVVPIGGVETTLNWTLEDVAGGTRLTLVHEGVGEAGEVAPLDQLVKVDAGWDQHFALLRAAISN